MNRLVFGLTPLLVIGLLVVAIPADGAVLSPTPPAALLLAQNLPNSDNPYNSPIRRANPNSRQGSESATPPVRGLNTQPTPRPSTIENGAIRNGYPRDQQAPMAVPIQPGTRADPNQRR
ncbi:hypothetical protein [Pseudomonas gingeri]|uniref:hypothetical protein n=1 Tax=Pseudomonas gingeri TaxID=117681 RepID=UPI0015A4812A|nr:hypothetical protein [Pseudomonas gingeri]NWA01805.1 hypothetical protein [Pseudomonas gingeri]NWA12904.1 hypothetical protein [Pseudomonas gingeri]NWA57646.1 hypothetical protein [Pseudomonas gingeri]NWA93275.1 hypothetical protein [Pseudomonas gingeri]NWB03365.1 hypothetical protein [Pseudomonas gingeri]